MPPQQPPTSALSLLVWLESRGARFPGAQPVHVPGMGTGLVATDALPAEAEVLFVPRDVWLTRKTVHTRFRPVLDAVQAAGVFSHSMSRLALLLALEARSDASFFRPYLSRIGDPTVPYGLDDDERGALAGLPMERWIDEQAALTETECAAIDRVLRALPTPLDLDLPRWRWAYGHVMQRTFSVDVDDEEVWVLVPGMDLCNHADDPNACFYAEDDGWMLETVRPVESGEQITIRYGRAKTSADLLLYYGFVTPENPHDRVRLSLDLPEDDPDREAKTEALDVLGLESSALVGPDGDVPSRFLHAAILWGLDSEAFRADVPDVASPERAVVALEAIASALARDAATLDGTTGPATGWVPTFAAYRTNVSRSMARAASRIRSRAEAIRSAGWSPADRVIDDPDGRFGLATVTVRP